MVLLGLEQAQIYLELGDGVVGDAAFGARAAELRLHPAFLEGGLMLEFSWFAFPAILQAEVDLLADCIRQPRDFSISCHKKHFLIA